MKRRLCYVISDVDTSLLIDGTVRFTSPRRYELTTVFLAAEEPRLFSTLQDDGFDVRFVRCRGKSDLPAATLKLRALFREIRPDIVHTHLFHAAIAGGVAAKLAGVKAVVNTRHHSVEAHLYHPHAVWYDRFTNALSTHIVAITGMVARVLVERENVSRDKISVVHHGFDMSEFANALARGSDLRAKYDLEGSYPVVGVISRFIHWKGLQYVIPAFEKILAEFPDAKLGLANAEGSYEPEVHKLLESIDAGSYRLIRFEPEVLELYKSFDVFVHAPIGPEYEAFGQVYVEALAMKRPSVFTLSGIADDFIVDHENALVVPFEDSDSIASAVTTILRDSGLRERLGENGHAAVGREFTVQRMVERLDDVYSKVLDR
jgi:glycosyltransferase involved in cell wall biosynthesis